MVYKYIKYIIGATGLSGHFAINSDTFIYFIKTEKWEKLNRISLYKSLNSFR